VCDVGNDITRQTFVMKQIARRSGAGALLHRKVRIFALSFLDATAAVCVIQQCDEVAIDTVQHHDGNECWRYR